MTLPPTDAPDGLRPPPTQRGAHDMLMDIDVAGARDGGFRPNRTLPTGVEFVRQLRRRRTHLVALILLLLPLAIALAFQASSPGSSSGTNNGNFSGPLLATLATKGAINFALFTEFASASFLLVVLVALFCGDTVASEASWSSLRYLLAIPVPRARLLRQKLIVALSLSLGANVLLPAWALVIGGMFFGWAPAQSPLGGSFTTGEGLTRLLIVVGYASLQSLLVAALAFLFGVLTDAPLGAVGGATMVVVLSNILDSITALDPYRKFLPTHFQYAWLDAVGPGIQWDNMMRGSGLVLVYSAVFFALAWWHFQRKDIVS
ncbi:MULTISPECIES: ABC transporter permease [unclassified Pseudofrankia]|uniref:ABC transporter permease n=1 Tax=unclassified Pseudofrankia TaxID=2994372 RepID=UPI0009F520A0|nr:MULTISPECIES: ABC transporter permease [unclassified Pseudofrankia]MDT3439363.1 ABC transporter permease [Pseudofrankia sp. BMG5.37]